MVEDQFGVDDQARCIAGARWLRAHIELEDEGIAVAFEAIEPVAFDDEFFLFACLAGEAEPFVANPGLGLEFVLVLREADECFDILLELGLQRVDVLISLDDEVEFEQLIEAAGLPAFGEVADLAEGLKLTGESGRLGIHHAFGHVLPEGGAFFREVEHAVADDILDEAIEFVEAVGYLFFARLLAFGLGGFVDGFVFLFCFLFLFFRAFAEPFGDPGGWLG